MKRATFGKLVEIYKNLRPRKTALIANLQNVSTVRNRLVHNLLIEPVSNLLNSIPEALRDKPIKDIMTEILEDIQEVTSVIIEEVDKRKIPELLK